MPVPSTRLVALGIQPYGGATFAAVGIVNNIAALKARSVSGLATGYALQVLGYTNKNDNGGGVFYYDSASSAAVNLGTCFAPTVGAGRWFRVFDSSNILVDWFGAHGDGATDDRAIIQAAIDYASTLSRANVILSAKTYAISDFLFLNQNYLGLIGAGQNYTRLLVTSASHDAIQVGQSIGPNISIPTLRGFAIDKSVPGTAGTGVSLIKTSLAKVSDIHVNAHVVGFNFTAATNSTIERCGASCGVMSADFTGFLFNGNAIGSIMLGSVSSVLRNCWVDASSNTGTSKGLEISGNSISDLYIYDLGTLRCTYGRYIDGTRAGLLSPPYNWDIFFGNCTDDEFKGHGCFITANATIGGITIKGGWSNPGASGTGSGIFITGSQGVTISGHQFDNIGQLATSRGLTIDGCKNITVSGCLVTDQAFGIYLLNSSTGCSVSGNAVYNQSTLPASTSILLSTVIRNKIIGNTVNGYSAVGIADDVTSAKNIFCENVIDPSNVTTPTALLGTGNVVANNVTT